MATEADIFVQIGVSANGNPIFVPVTELNPVPVKLGTAGGASPVTLVTANSNNQTTVKASAGALYSIQGVSIANASAMWIKVFDATSITPGVTPATYQVGIPAASSSQGSGVIWSPASGISHLNGIIIMVTGGIGLTDNTSVSAGAAGITVLFK